MNYITKKVKKEVDERRKKYAFAKIGIEPNPYFSHSQNALFPRRDYGGCIQKVENETLLNGEDFNDEDFIDDCVTEKKDDTIQQDYEK